MPQAAKKEDGWWLSELTLQTPLTQWSGDMCGGSERTRSVANYKGELQVLVQWKARHWTDDSSLSCAWGAPKKTVSIPVRSSNVPTKLNWIVLSNENPFAPNPTRTSNAQIILVSNERPGYSLMLSLHGSVEHWDRYKYPHNLRTKVLSKVELWQWREQRVVVQ